MVQSNPFHSPTFPNEFTSVLDHPYPHHQYHHQMTQQNGVPSSTTSSSNYFHEKGSPSENNQHSSFTNPRHSTPHLSTFENSHALHEHLNALFSTPTPPRPHSNDRPYTKISISESPPSSSSFQHSKHFPQKGQARDQHFFDPSSSSSSEKESSSTALVLSKPNATRPHFEGLDPATLMEDPIGALYILCQQRNLPMPQYIHKSIPGTRLHPFTQHGMDIVVKNIKKSVPIVHETKEDAEIAAAFLGFEILGLSMDPRHPPRSLTSRPSLVKDPPKFESQPLAPRSTLNPFSALNSMEPTLGTMGATYFQCLQRLLHRYHMLLPKFKHEAVSTFPPRHVVALEFYGHHFEAMHAKKMDARQLVAKQAYEYLSSLPEFQTPPVDYRALLTAFARTKKLHSPRFFDPSNGQAPGGGVMQTQMGVIVGDYEFIEEYSPDIYSSTGAKQLVSKKAYTYLVPSFSSSTTKPRAALPPLPTNPHASHSKGPPNGKNAPFSYSTSPSPLTFSSSSSSSSSSFHKCRYDVYQPSLEVSQHHHQLHGPMRLSQRGKKGTKAHYVYEDDDEDDENATPVAYKMYEPSYASKYNFAFEETAFQDPYEEEEEEEGNEENDTPMPMSSHATPSSYSPPPPSRPGSYERGPPRSSYHTSPSYSYENKPSVVVGGGTPSPHLYSQQRRPSRFPSLSTSPEPSYSHPSPPSGQEHHPFQAPSSSHLSTPSPRAYHPRSSFNPSNSPHYNFPQTENLNHYYDEGADITSHYL
ncbi:hypothetical protein HMI54_004447 [Coelomomyces lativittatus]|nr:hypothetical protein HMI56_003037 [Coelomomyces lativittatus]KAJ1507136.1 hypothetical protein HMI54_004447 [Coelomomyces lativittatus]KAJ1517873.1 hypothetical protein HMI55_005294 [Coelomomyces lativittatus]